MQITNFKIKNRFVCCVNAVELPIGCGEVAKVLGADIVM
jgi:hypothetical protein